MRRTVARAVVVAALGALLLAAAACGGDDGQSAAGTQTASAAGATQEPATTDTPTTTEGSASSDFASASNCREFAELGAKVSQAVSGSGGSDIEKTKKLVDEFADKAPDEIRDDFKVVADAWSKIAEALEGADLSSGGEPDPEALAKLQKLGEELDQPRLQQAYENITAWVESNCGGVSAD